MMPAKSLHPIMRCSRARLPAAAAASDRSRPRPAAAEAGDERPAEPPGVIARRPRARVAPSTPLHHHFIFFRSVAEKGPADRAGMTQ